MTTLRACLASRIDDFSNLPAAAVEERLLSKIEFQRLADVPPEAEWFANLTNENTKRAYRHDVTSFMPFVGIKRPEDFRTVARAHVIAWGKMLEKRKLAPATVRRKLSALSDLYDYLVSGRQCWIALSGLGFVWMELCECLRGD